MTAACLSPLTLSNAQRQFENALPQIQRSLKFYFRHCPRRFRAEALAATWHAWVGLVRRGQDPVLLRVTGIAFNAYRCVKSGRRLGCGSCGRSRVDILDSGVLGRLRLQVASLGMN